MKIARMFPSIIFIITLMFTIFTNADCLNESEALAIGVEKYLEFLWMVDGAFNNSKFNDEFTVNEKKLDDDNKKFTCTYVNKNSNRCVGNNFEEEFKKVFASNLTYNKVYGDGVLYTWFKYEKGKYVFDVSKSCNIHRMDTSQKMVLSKITNNKLIFKVSGSDDDLEMMRSFVLIKENDDWKVSIAYYSDICYMDYYIE